MIELGRFEQIERLYHAALEREPEAREAFLDEACAGDEGLRREVAGLLACDHPSDSFIQSPAIEIAAKAMAAESLMEALNKPMGSAIAGSKIGAYQLLEPLGRGGMGEVHLALDTRLGRKVALKILPAAFTTDAGRVRRFAQEARAASALNHPNIITIHEIGEVRTADGDTHYIVTEYVEGETLRHRMANAPQGRLSLSEALDVAVQVAAALATAHEAGIAHRDIKPENVMVRRDGIVKVLDFGLAKLTEPAAPVIDSQGPTLFRNSTEAGIVMGTPRYMSPEQARGEKVDPRTDIFSLGVTIYEMIAGRAPFGGATLSEVIASILRDAPPPLAEWAPDAPQELERIAGKALRKDREERYQVVKDLLLDLKSVKQDLELEAKLKGTEAPELIARHTARSESSRATSSAEYILSEIKRHKRGVFAGLATLAIAIVAIIWFILSNRQLPQTDQIPANRTLTQLTFDEGLQSEPTWSPDGRFIAYSSDSGGNSDIWVRPVGSGDPVPITKSPAHDWQPDWSPDGANIVFRSERDGGGLFVVSPLGGNERKIASFGFHPRWSPDGSKILFESSNYDDTIEMPKVYVVSLNGGAPREVLADLRGELAQRQGSFYVAWGPDSQRVSLWGDGPQMGWAFWTGSISGSSSIKSEIAPNVDQQIKDASITLGPFRWANAGRALYFEGFSKGVSNIWRIVVEPQTLRWVAGPERLTVGPGADADIAPSPDGKKLAFTTQTSLARAWSLPFNALIGRTTGTGQAVTPAGVRVANFDLSVDGSKLAFVSERAGKYEVWKKTLADGQETLLRAADDADISLLSWSPDGTRIAYVRISELNTPQFKFAVAMVSSDNADEQLLTTPNTSREVPYGWSADGKWLLISSSRNTPGRQQICRIPVTAAPLAETGMEVITSHPESNLFQSYYSPNERWIVFIDQKISAPGISTIYTAPASGGEWTRITEGKYLDDMPRWAPDGKKLYFLSSRGGSLNLWGIRFDPLNGKPEGEPFRITNFQGPSRMLSSLLIRTGIAFSPNRLFLPIVEVSGSIWLLENLDR